MLEHGHTPLFVFAAFAIALMAGFTGLSLTRGASAMPIARRKLAVSMSAVALGSGIWSMHFVAMLGMRLPVQFYYDALITMMSALVAIILTGFALLLVHFGERTPPRITAAGACVSIGIIAMHYLGMSGMQVAQPVYSNVGLLIAVASSFALCIGAFWIAYGNRDNRNIIFGTFCFGVAVCAVHFIAMAGTHFVRVDTAGHSGLWISNEVLAFGVTLSSFAISGAFLLVSATFFNAPKMAVDQPMPAPQPSPGKVPYEKDGRTHFVPDTEIAAVRAEGHYTFLYHSAGRLFCPWSISEVEARVTNPDFMKCHRSYLINGKHVTGFERRKDNGVCYFEKMPSIEKAPVSRSFLKDVRARLGL